MGAGHMVGGALAPGACRLGRARPTSRVPAASVVVAVLLAGCASPSPEAATAAPPADAASPADRAAVLAVVQRVFDAINTADPAPLHDALAPGAHVAMLGEGGRSLGVDGMAAMLEGATEPWVERMWDPEVRVHGDVASVWAPYDFYRGGRFSHCGVDAFLLERRGGAWRVASLVWVREQPPACELHPEGPPP